MSYNNELYIFSEVPDYDSSKDERFKKAFQNLKIKIQQLEQVGVSETNTSLQTSQADNLPELTVEDVQKKLLSTQTRYLIKLVKEFGNNDEPTDMLRTNISEKQKDTNLLPAENSQVRIESNKNNEAVQKNLSEERNKLLANFSSNSEQKTPMAGLTSIGPTQSTISNEKAPKGHINAKPHQHYHLKLDDVPFILGTSSSASHSVVANLQSVISMMKSHNKALCDPKVPAHSKVSSSQTANKECATDANEMIREISEDLLKITQKQKNLVGMFSKPPTHKYEKPETLKKAMNIQDAGNLASKPSTLSVLTEKEDSGSKMDAEASHMPFAPKIRIQNNNNPQLASRKMLHSLKAFKRHLSKEDLSWE